MYGWSDTPFLLLQMLCQPISNDAKHPPYSILLVLAHQTPTFDMQQIPVQMLSNAALLRVVFVPSSFVRVYILHFSLGCSYRALHSAYYETTTSRNIHHVSVFLSFVLTTASR